MLFLGAGPHAFCFERSLLWPGKFTANLPSGTLTWQWKITLLKMYSLLKMGIFHCYVSLPEGIIKICHIIIWGICLLFFSPILFTKFTFTFWELEKKLPSAFGPSFSAFFFRFFFPFEAHWHLTSPEVLEGGWTICPQFLVPKNHTADISKLGQLGSGFTYFFAFTLYLGKWFDLTNIFQMGWN